MKYYSRRSPQSNAYGNVRTPISSRHRILMTSRAIDFRWVQLREMAFRIPFDEKEEWSQQVEIDTSHFHRKSDVSSWHDRHSHTHMYQSANEVNGDKNRVSDFLFFYFRRIRVTFVCECRVTTTIKLPIITRLLNRFRYFKYFVSSLQLDYFSKSDFQSASAEPEQQPQQETLKLKHTYT